MDLQDFLRTLTIMELFHINGYGVYGLIGAVMGCVVLPPKSFHEFMVRVSCGVVFSFTLTPLAGPLLGGIVEANLGPRAAEQLYQAPAGVGVLVGMLAYFAASFVLHVARHSKDDVVTNRTTIHDIQKRNQDTAPGIPPAPLPPTPPAPPRSTDSLPWPDPNPSPDHKNRDTDIWSL
jgi:MFS family permease